MEKLPVDEIVASSVKRIAELGFNCVRVAYSLEAHVRSGNPFLEEQFVKANRFLSGKRFLDGFDAGIEALTKAGLMVIIDQCPGETSNFRSVELVQLDEGLWMLCGTFKNVPSDELELYRGNSFVVGIDLRNEVHDLHSNPKWGNGLMMTWGDNDPKTDWAAAATRAGNRVLAENQEGLQVVMALCFGMELRPMRSHPIKLDLPNRVVYETHNYVEYQFWNLIPRDLGITFSTLRTITMLSCGKLRLELRRLSFERHDLLPSETLEEACCVGGAWSALFSLIFMAMAFTTYKAQADRNLLQSDESCDEERLCAWDVTREESWTAAIFIETPLQQVWLDKQWGFALEEGQAFTAINGIKYSEGFNQANGGINWGDLRFRDAVRAEDDVELRALEADEDCTQAADGSCSLELLQAGSRREAWDDEPTAWGDLSHYGRFTGGTCSFWNCDQSRGPTICHHLKCICAEGYLAFAGTCRSESEQPTTALGTRTGETCRMGYCTVPHSTCKAGKCFCGRGYTANNGVCQVVRCIWRTGCLFWCLVLSVELGLVESTGPKGTTAEILLVENCEIGKRR
ncbi:4-beta-glucanase E1) (Endocellulase E1) [Durusdinium trenchii]|uniref:4-beta-glucanase E1 (Endocellulase E1 n=1 Tax=Durusdinium trenchii TaxID=1381693 RepID=A0ABP0PCS9_9DINO